MNDLLTFQNFFDVVIMIGVLFYGVGQFKSGRSEKKEKDSQIAVNTVQLLQTRADTFEKDLKEMTAKYQQNHDEIIRLQEQSKHKDAQIEQLTQILQGKNPEMETFMKLLTSATTATAKYQETTAGILNEIKDWMETLDTELQKKIEIKVV